MSTKIIFLSSCFTLGVLASSTALAESIAGRESEPQRLTKLQMDNITAGTLIVGSVANAAAAGDSTYTHTKTNTYAFSAPLNIIQVGLGSGWAYACCGSDTDASVDSAYYGDGGIVIGKSFEVEETNPRFSWAAGGIIAIAIDPLGR